MTISIFTGSWRSRIDDTKYQRVAVSRGAPRGRQHGASGFRKFTRLAPGPWFADPLTPTVWADRYRKEILGALDPARTVAELRALSTKGLPIVLLCWEAAGGDQWCHRGLISEWLKDRLDLNVCELDDAECNCGREHPLLPKELRQ